MPKIENHEISPKIFRAIFSELDAPIHILGRPRNIPGRLEQFYAAFLNFLTRPKFSKRHRKFSARTFKILSAPKPVGLFQRGTSENHLTANWVLECYVERFLRYSCAIFGAPWRTGARKGAQGRAPSGLWRILSAPPAHMDATLAHKDATLCAKVAL